jgi:hypothetical protein
MQDKGWAIRIWRSTAYLEQIPHDAADRPRLRTERTAVLKERQNTEENYHNQPDQQRGDEVIHARQLLPPQPAELPPTHRMIFFRQLSS